MDRIVISGLEIFAYHGVNEEEKRDGQLFILDIELFADLTAAKTSDDLADTVNYAAVRKTIERAFTSEKFNLIEKAAKVVCNKVLAEFDAVRKIKLRLKKPNAPMNAVFSYVAVEIAEERA